ncbi:inactive poly [ADP-ribose] polymerase RCD1-like [Vicia villosa]|uniref:inactive poly [ADP-ribose] polymerase RCD1-like n=1 Tax=Vicia villosa TaxID=3911 RepID=UPI00273CB0EA|nr:inactive poly [ADP-ribose] polymerase RCD1-like [Vicia villosa]
MADKSPKVLDGATLNGKRKRYIRRVAHLTEVLEPTNLTVKQMRLVGDERQPTNSSPAISKYLVKYFLNYKKSGLPKRLMFFNNGDWSDYPEDFVDLIKKDFEIKKAFVEVEVDGKKVVLDFLHMCNVNLQTGLQQPIAWIDEAGNCFFPELFVGSDEESNILGEKEGRESHGGKEKQELKYNLSNELNGADESKLVKYSGDSNALVKDIKINGQHTTNKMRNVNVEATSNQYREIDIDAYTEPIYGRLDVDSVQHLFLTRMATFGISEGDIVDVYRNLGSLMQARLELFQKQADITKLLHSDANVRYGWLACSKNELSTMMEYGLGHNALLSSKFIYGLGIHLAAVIHPYACALYCDVDENGVRHLLLCRVIMGNMEPLCRGTKQIRPSGCEYDNGVDDIQQPNYYVVWNMNMKTHIFPEYVVSFKAPWKAAGNTCLNEKEKKIPGNNYSTLDTVNAASVPNTSKALRLPWIPFPMLFTAIRPKVPSKHMLLIKAHYTELVAKEISYDEFVKKLRSIVGDNILRSVVINLQNKGPSNNDPGRHN